MQKDKIQRLQNTNRTKYKIGKWKCEKMQINSIETEKIQINKIQNDRSGKIQAWQNAKLSIVTVVFH